VNIATVNKFHFLQAALTDQMFGKTSLLKLIGMENFSSLKRDMKRV
jgi:hypothetical protein